MSAEPWSKFYWSDYDADEGLRMCSLAAQGLWMRMLCLMARATPKGELRVGGTPCTVSDLSRAVGETEETVERLLGELRRRGVYSVTRAGVIFSRRLRKDAEISRKRAKSGAQGAAVRYSNDGENPVCHGKSLAKPLAKAWPQKPEARNQTPPTPSPGLPDGDAARGADELCRLAGVPNNQPAAIIGNVATVKGWLDDGITLDEAREAIAKRMKDKPPSDPVSRLAYFNANVRHARAVAQAAGGGDYRSTADAILGRVRP